MRHFDRFLRPTWAPTVPEEGELTGAYPADIYETDDQVVVEAEMPGFARDEIDVNLDQGVLSITAERKSPERQGTKHLSERRYTRVERAFSLPTAVDEDNVQATLEDGVLRIELPKTAETKRRKIEISS
ncbi:MAG: Hsp20/alpha crystallin family protein [bacterium]